MSAVFEAAILVKSVGDRIVIENQKQKENIKIKDFFS